MFNKILKNENFKILLLGLLLFIIALIPRFYLLNEAEIYPDEITWTVRSKEVFESLRQPNFAYFENAWWNKKDDTEATAIPLTSMGGLSLRFFGQTVSTHSFKLLTDIESVRLPVVMFTAFFVGLFFYYLKFLAGIKIAFVVAILLAFDPIFLALSRWALNDALLTIFTTLSLISYIVDIKQKRLTPIPGIFLALSFLTKPNGLVPIIGWILITLLPNHYQKKIYIFSFNLTFFALLVYVMWPSMWTNPLYVFEYLIRQTQLTQSGITNYFLGTVTTNPPFYYYLFQIGTRLPPLIVVGFLAMFLINLSKVYKFKSLVKRILNHPEWIAIVVYCLVFFIAISFTPKKLGARYALPLWPWIYLAAILYWSKLSNYLGRYSILVFGILISVTIFLNLAYTPKFYFYYNSFIGGPTVAQKYDLPHLCLGAQKTGSYINSFYPDISRITYLGCGSTTFPFYSAVPITTNIEVESDLIILEDSYMKLKPNNPTVMQLKATKPLAIISDKGIVLARIYKKLD